MSAVSVSCDAKCGDFAPNYLPCPEGERGAPEIEEWLNTPRMWVEFCEEMTSDCTDLPYRAWQLCCEVSDLPRFYGG